MKKYIPFSTLLVLSRFIPVGAGAATPPQGLPPPPPPPALVDIHIPDKAAVNSTVHINVTSGGHRFTGGAVDVVQTSVHQSGSTIVHVESRTGAHDGTTVVLTTSTSSTDSSQGGTVHVEVRGWDPKEKKEITVARDIATHGSAFVSIEHPANVQSVDDL